ncbi:MAG: hypothetical protein AAFZ65_09265 [Planctomycetota bacterium]
MLLTSLLLLTCQSPVAPTAVAPDDEGAFVAQGVEILLAMQEDYRPDPPVGRLDEDQLTAWQTKERARLDVLRQDASAPSEWPYEGVYRVGPDGRIPSGYRVGGTSIVCLALLAAWPEGGERSRRALGRGVDFVVDGLDSMDDLAKGAKRGYDVRGWGFTYALALALDGLDHPALDEPRREALRASVPGLIERLAANREQGGGWNYAGRGVSPFQTGATLLELYEARARGFEIPQDLIQTALEALEAGRTKSTTFAYSGPARSPVAGPGSAARSSVAELAMQLAGRSDDLGVERAIAVFFDGWDELLARAGKQGTHEGEFGIAPYYFMFGHLYAAEAIEQLPPKVRAAWRRELMDKLQQTRDPWGGWNDRIFPRSQAYGTAMALLAIRASERKRPSLDQRPGEAGASSGG